MTEKTFEISVPTWVIWKVKAENENEAIEKIRQRDKSGQNFKCYITGYGVANLEMARTKEVSK